ncbi:MAG: valine--pyruvate transaminase [Spirochaetales bacterium]|nr:valine--pyruvate transaminase [Spirochaetales bacterium]
MELSRFGRKITAKTGILSLMEDLGKAVAGTKRYYMLGGGNPALIPEVCDLWRRRMREILDNGDQFEKMIGRYDTSKGNQPFLEALAGLLSREYGWDISPRNIAVTNGSQTAFYFLINMFCGTYPDGSRKKILFPISPEYIGYADQSIEEDSFVSCIPMIEQIDTTTFKYHIDFSKLDSVDNVGAVCVSRPTNPTGNVLTGDELTRLSAFADSRKVPLLVDNAYGLPFPGIIFEDAQPFWDKHVVLSMSLSKIGLPSVRNGIVVAAEEVIEALSASNAVLSLATGNIGQVIMEPFIASGEIIDLCKDVITPYYRTRAYRTIEWISEALDGVCEYSIHKAQGALFLWLWFKNLPVTTGELYYRLKERDVLVIPGRHFFFGLAEEWKHRDECIRINYAGHEAEVREGIVRIGEVVKELS